LLIVFGPVASGGMDTMKGWPT